MATGFFRGEGGGSGSRRGGFWPLPLRVVLRVVLGAAFPLLPQVVQDLAGGEPQGAQRGGGGEGQQDHDAADLGEGEAEGHGQHAPQHAAGGHGLAGGPELAEQLRRPGVVHPAQDQVEHGPDEHGQAQRPREAQADGPAPVEDENPRRQQQQGRGDVKAVAAQALEQVAEQGDNRPLSGLEVADGPEQGQQQAHHPADLPAVGLPLGGGPPGTGAGAGSGLGGGTPAAAAAFCCGLGTAAAGAGGFLLCGCHGEPPVFSVMP